MDDYRPLSSITPNGAHDLTPLTDIQSTTNNGGLTRHTTDVASEGTKEQIPSGQDEWPRYLK